MFRQIILNNIPKPALSIAVIGVGAGLMFSPEALLNILGPKVIVGSIAFVAGDIYLDNMYNYYFHSEKTESKSEKITASLEDLIKMHHPCLDAIGEGFSGDIVKFCEEYISHY